MNSLTFNHKGKKTLQECFPHLVGEELGYSKLEVMENKYINPYYKVEFM